MMLCFVVMHILILSDGDYDGDMLYMRAVFTQEANAEADKLIWSKTNMLNATGEVSRRIKQNWKRLCDGII